MIVMMKDTPVFVIDINTGIVRIFSELYIPFALRGRLSESDDVVTRVQNIQAVEEYFASRVLPIDRENAKKIYNLLKLNQLQSIEERFKVAVAFKGLSLQDNYWIKSGNEKWSDVSLRSNSLSRAVAQVALHGVSLTLSGEVRTPEVTTQGAYAKCWMRESGSLYLYKRGYKGDKQSHIEVEVSRILDKTNVSHVKYLDASSRGKYCCKCECITTDTLSNFKRK